MSIEINLLPWREERRQRKGKQFQVGLLMVAVFGLGAGYAVSWYYDQQLSAQRERQNFIEQRTVILDKEIVAVNRYEESIALLKQRVNVLQSLQAERPLTVHVLNALAESLQDDVYYSSLERQDDSLKLSGMALIDSGVSSQMLALDAAPVFGESHFAELEANSGGRRFSLSVSQHMPVADAQQQQEDAP